MKSDHINRVFLKESYIRSFIKWWLAVVIISLPFQTKLTVLIKPFSNDLSDFVGYLDELTIVVLLPLALFKIYKNKEYPVRLYNALAFPLILLLISGVISGFVNKNPFNVTALGIFAHLKYFPVIFIFAAFYQNYDEANDIFNILIKAALFIVAIALIQEVWALTSRYVLGMDYNLAQWRLGIYRPASLMSSPNIFGLYILLIFIIYLSVTEKINYFIFTVFLMGIIFSLSRVVYTGLIFLCIAQIYRKKKPFMYVLLPILVVMVTMVFLKNIDLNKTTHLSKNVEHEISSYSDYRKSTREISIRIWKDHMLFGTGPGMYGGLVSLKNKSKIYREYSYPLKSLLYLRNSGNIDQFWFQVLAEMGIVGVISFCLLFISISVVLLILRIWASSNNIGNLFVGLFIITLTIVMFTTYTGLANTSLMFTFSAIIGMAIGSEKEEY